NTDGYAPGSLPPRCEVITTSAGPTIKEAIASCVRDAHRGTEGRSFTATQRASVTWGRVSYVTFLTATVLLLGFTVGNFLVETVLGPLNIAQPVSLSDWLALSGRIWGALEWPAVKKVAAVAIQTGVSSHWVVLLAKNVVRSPWLVLLFIASF